MSAQVDISKFRQAIGNDEEAERYLLGLFISTMDEAVTALDPALFHEDWNEHLHLIKGASLNVGASGLSDLAMRGQSLTVHQQEEKQQLYEALVTQYQDVRNYLLSLIS